MLEGSIVRRNAVHASMLCAFLGLFLMAATAIADDQESEKPVDKPAAKAPEAEKAAPEKPAKTATVERGMLKITLDLDGTFVAQTSEEIVVRPEEWTSSGALTIDRVARHGARVKRDDELIQFDTTRIDRAIKDLRSDLQINQLSLQQAEQNLRALEEFTPIDLEANERTAQRSEEDQRYYFDRQRPFSMKVIEFSLQSSKDRLEYAEEELRQLEKMYEEDDLIEETEAIVLKRARNSVEAARMSLASAQMSHDFSLEFTMPRNDETIRESARRTRLQTQRNSVTLPLTLERQQLEVEKLHQQRLRSEERLKKLEADRQAMTVTSPLDGIVYYGREVRGRFSDSVTQSETLSRFSTVQPNRVLMTVVQPQPLSILVSVAEEHLYRMRSGLSGSAVPKAYPNMKLPVTMRRISTIPTAPGQFEGEFRVPRGEQTDKMVPGMT
ncbi:MAG: hypothetical protein EA424_17835, partial [Planctomycetaceae bacterium]